MILNCSMWNTLPQTQNVLTLGTMLYTYEDNESVIQMLIKGRSPAMRHVSRTHRVALAWLFDGIKLEPKIQIKYVDTNGAS